MLWAQLQLNNDRMLGARLLGILVAMAICGAIPMIAGISRGQTVLGIVGGVVSAGGAFILGCVLGLPLAALFTIVICFLMPDNRDSQGRKRWRQEEDDYDDEYDRRPRRRRRRLDEEEEEEEERASRARRRATADDDYGGPRRRRRDADDEDDRPRRRRDDLDDRAR